MDFKSLFKCTETFNTIFSIIENLIKIFKFIKDSNKKIKKYDKQLIIYFLPSAPRLLTKGCLSSPCIKLLDSFSFM